MGMAASQARFLGLTARKTNVEFEGQQINQQRTTLGNQYANYYNQLLGMAVPVPPSIQDYTKTVYTFQDGNLNNNITALVAQQNGLYKVSYVSSWQNDFAAVSNGAAIVFNKGESKKDVVVSVDATIESTNYNFKRVSANKFVNEDLTDPIIYIPEEEKYTYKDEEISVTENTEEKDVSTYAVGNTVLRTLRDKSSIADDPYYKTLNGDEAAIKKALDYEKDLEGILKKKYGNDTNWLVRYVKDTTSGVWNPIFYQKEIVEAAQYNKESGASQSNIPSYKIGSAVETEEVKGVEARLEKDATGRYISITLLLPQEGTDEKIELNYALTTNTTTDQAAYNDAMNQYEFDKYTYDQSIQEINAKIEVVQAEDRNLELRLKQLDTEQDAIQTEMDAVQKVIEKNTESTFKTFG